MNQKFCDTFTVINEKGIHARPASELVKCAATFKAQVFLHYRGITVNARSLLDILVLCAMQGAKVTVEAIGEDAKEAVNAILKLAKEKFCGEC